MSAPLVFAFCQEAERQTVRDACEAAGIAPPWFEKVPRPLGVKPRLILLAIGPEGGAALARWVDSHGLNGVVGVGLAGVTAPWAERRSPLTQTLEESDAGRGAPFPLPLGPIEPLRAVAERARLCAPLCPSCRSERVRPDTDDCKHFICGCGHAFTPTPLRIVIACAPNDGVCGVCDGIGDMPHFSGEQCKACDGEGKALSSAQVASELVGVDVGSTTDSMASGGTWVDVYSSNVALADHGLRSVIESLTR